MERIELDMHEVRSERRAFQTRCSVDVAITISAAPRNRTNSFWNFNSALSFVCSLWKRVSISGDWPITGEYISKTRCEGRSGFTHSDVHTDDDPSEVTN